MPRSASFRTIKYPIVGDSLIMSAKDISQQRTKNMYAVPTPNGLKDAALISFPGMKRWSTGPVAAPDRGIYRRLFLGKAFKVNGDALYSFDSTGVQTKVGNIGGTALVSFADNGTTLVICNGLQMYTYDGTTLAVLALPFAPVMVDYLNSQFIAMDASNSVYTSTPGTLTFSASDVFSPESLSDDLVAIKVYNQFLFNFGTETIEPWENTGTGSPPFERMNGAIIEDVGVASRNAIASTSEAVYFLGTNKTPYRLVNFQAQSLTESNYGIAELFATYNSATCFVEAFRLNGQDIIIYVFPDDSIAWAYSQQVGLWFELDYDLDAKLWLGKTVARLFDKTLIGDRSDGHIYELDSSTFQNNGKTMVRERVFRPLSGEALESPRQRAQLKCIRFAVETGVGVSDDNPQMIVSFSFDGNRNFGNERWLSLGQQGDYQETVETYSNQKFKDVCCKIRYTENTRFSLYASSIDFKAAGR